MDVDALTMDPRETVLKAAAEVAREQGLSETWLNDQVRTVSKVPVVPDERAKVLYDSPHLVVTGASESHMLAMKLHAARRGRDDADIKCLIRLVGVRHMPGLEEIHQEVFRGEGIPSRAYQRIAELLREVQEEDRLRWARGGEGQAQALPDFGPER